MVEYLVSAWHFSQMTLTSSFFQIFMTGCCCRNGGSPSTSLVAKFARLAIPGRLMWSAKRKQCRT